MDTTTAPLENYRIVGIEERVHCPVPGGPQQPGGSCWHCGTAIRICVLVRSTVDATEETHTIGTTCAERIGLDPAGLKRHLAERFAEQRALAAHLRSQAYRDEQARLEAEATAQFGPHGTEGRWASGCRCDACVTAGPHGEWSFNARDCRCHVCVAAMLDDPDYYVRPVTMLVNVDTGAEVADARTVSTRYGLSWRSDALDLWAPVSPARRSTLTKRGVTEAEVPALVRRAPRSSNRSWYFAAWVGCPLADSYGEALPQRVDVGCTGTRYLVNDDAPDEGTDVHHTGPCPVHPTTTS